MGVTGHALSFRSISIKAGPRHTRHRGVFVEEERSPKDWVGETEALDF